jgi:predicted kinase
MNKPNMYLMCGISGSGKTTFSIDFATRNNLLRLGIDDFYAKINGNECNHSNTFEVWIEYFKAIHEAELNNIDCILDTNALTWHQRMQFIEWFPNFNHHIIFIDSDFEQQLKNNNSRMRKVPETKMIKMSKELQIPTSELDFEYDSIVHIQNYKNCFQKPKMIKGSCPLFDRLLP